MKKLVLFLLLVVAIQSYGIYGAVQTQSVAYTCTVEVGPLCYAWEESALSKLFGAEAASRFDDKLKSARRTWEEDFVKRLSKAKDESELEKAFERAREALEGAADGVRRAFE